MDTLDHHGISLVFSSSNLDRPLTPNLEIFGKRGLLPIVGFRGINMIDKAQFHLEQAQKALEKTKGHAKAIVKDGKKIQSAAGDIQESWH